MKRKLIFALGVLMGVVLLAALITPFVFDINKYRPEVKALLEEKLHAQVELGQMRLSILKGLGVEIRGIKISNPPNFPQNSLLEVAHVDVFFGALKSLFGRPNISIKLSQPSLNIYENEQKELNVLKLLKPSTKEKAPSISEADQKAPEKIKAATGIAGYFMSKSSVVVTFTQGHFSYFKANGQSTNLNDLTLTLGPLNMKSNLPLKMSAVLENFKAKDISLKGPFKFSLTSSNPLVDSKKYSIELSAKLDGMNIQTLWYKKESTQPLALDLKGTYEQKTFNINTLDLTYPLGNLVLKDTAVDLNRKIFQTNLSLTMKTPSQDDPQFKNLSFESDLSLSLKAQGSLTPFLIKTGKGSVDIKKLAGEVPPFLSPFLLNRNLRVQGSGGVKFKGKFDLEDNKPTKLDLEDVEIDLSPLLLNYQDKWEKKAQQPLKIRVAGNIDLTNNKKKITLKSSSIQFDELILKYIGQITLTDKSNIDLSLQSNAFSPKLLTAYLPMLPFDYTGKITISDLHISGDPKDLSSLEVQGKVVVPQEQLIINTQYFEKQKWKTNGPILFSLNSSFHVKKKELLSLTLNSTADFSNASLTLGNSFIKPKNTQMKLIIESSLNNDTFKISQLDFSFHNLKAQVSGALKKFSSKKNRFCDLKINTAPFALDAWNQFFPTIKNKFKGSAEFKSLKLSFPLSNPKDLSVVGKMNLKDISGELPDDFIASKTLKLSGPFRLNLLSDLHYTKNNIKKMDLNGSIDLTQMALFKKDLFNKPEQVPLTLNLKVESKKNVILLNAITVKLKDLLLTLKGQILDISKKPLYKLELLTSQFSITQLSAFLPSLKKKNMTGNFKFGAQLKGRIHDEKSPINVKFAVKSDKLSYQKESDIAAKDTPSIKEDKKTSRDKNKAKNPLLKRLNASGDVIMNHIQFQSYELKDLRAKLSFKQDVLRLNPFSFNLYGGKFKASGTLDTKRQQPRTKIDSLLENIDLDQFFRSQKSKLQGKLSGILNSNMNISMQGMKWETIKKSLHAKGKITLRDGHFKVFNLTEAISAIPILSQVAPEFELSDRFSTLESSIFVKDQRLITPDIYLQGQSHLLKCEGTADFEGKLNYKGSYYLSSKEDFKKEIPFTVTGTVTKPVPLPDLGKLLQNKVKGVFEQILTPKGKGQEAPNEHQEDPQGGLIEDLLKDNLPF